jgi:DNA-binding GntR family transcriptional regulator
MKSAAARKTTKALSQSGVVDAIRQRILRSELVPGQRLVEAELCELLGASRGTVRTALIDLEHEGLVERIANRGARVRVVSIDEALQIAEVRMVVESLCVARAAERISDKDVRKIRGYADGLKKAAKDNDGALFHELTHAVFELYVKVADQPVAAEVLARLRARSTRHRFRLTFRPGRPQIAVPFWVAIIEAICARDPKAAEKALKAHAQNVQENMRAIAHEDRPFAVIYGRE